MIKRIFTLIVISFLISGCVSGPDGYFKRSANNKLFDRKGFHGGKRAPLYNKKYIHQAKENIAKGDIDDDFDDDDEDLYENYSIAKNNREMYRQMIEEDIERDKKYGKKTRYPSLVKANSRNSNFHDDENSDLREEIEEIKSMLQDAKRDLSSYRCPTAEVIERQNLNQNSSKLRDNSEHKNLKINNKKDINPHHKVSETIESI